MGLITEWFKWLHSLQKSDQSPLLKLAPEEQTELLNALRAYPMHPRFHEFCHMFEYTCPAPGFAERMRVPLYSLGKALDLKQIESTHEKEQRELQEAAHEAFRQRKRAFQEEADKNRRRYEAEAARIDAEREKRTRAKRIRERRLARAKRQKARVTYEPRQDGLLDDEGKAWATFVKERRKAPELPKPKGTAPVRKLPEVPEEPWYNTEEHQQWKERVEEIRSTR